MYKPTRLKIRTAAFCLFLSIALAAVPVKRTRLTVTQPDGTVFVLHCTGDEFYHLFTTEDGCAVVRTDDGTYRYDAFNAQGFRHATPYAVGDPETPQDVIDASRAIPYELLRRNANARRARAPLDRRPNLTRRVRTRHPATANATIPRHGIVILAQFKEGDFRFTRDDFERLLNGDGGKTAVDYFNDQFHGAFDFRFTVTDIVTLSKTADYYGKNDSEGNDTHAEEMVREACEQADEHVDFSLFDDDGDGEVDNVFVFFAGKDEADDPDRNADCIWSHAFFLSAGGIRLKLDGVTIDRYACSSELMLLPEVGKYTMASIGTFCHEYSHTFGLPDLYDTDYEGSGGTSDGLWRRLSLMDGGNTNNNGYTPPYYNAIERQELGMSEGLPLVPGNYTLEPIHVNGTYYIAGSDCEGEYYLFECRSNQGWDAAIGGSGLLIYHIDQSDRPTGRSDTYKRNLSASERWYIYNEVNARPDRQCADVVEADPTIRCDATASLVGRVFWPQENRSEFSASTDPPFVFWSGTGSTLALTAIRKVGDAVRFSVVGGVVERAPDAVLERQDVFQDAAIIQWASTDETYTQDGYISFSTGDGEAEEYAVAPYAPGKYVYVMDGLTPRTPYKARIYFKAGTIPGKVNEDCRFTTKSYYSGTFPYIYLTDAERTEDGAFAKGTEIPLRIYNAPDAEGVTWTFDGNHITPAANGYYVLSASGILKADIAYADGSHEIITKTVTVR